MELNIDTLTFGKYKNKTLSVMLKDRSYCKWFLQQDELRTKYEYIYNKVKEFQPRIYFLPADIIESENFVERYIYFNLTPVDKLAINLSDNEKTCYSFYLQIIEELKNKIILRVVNSKDNVYDIKAPVKWLQRFELETNLNRDEFKDFINSYELPNLPYVIEDIKKEGGLIYNGANSFNIAKARSKEQEKFWEDILKEKYGEDLSVQFLYEKCIFDFLNISTNTIYECKLSLKDFSQEQYDKYLLALREYKILYLIDRDAILDIKNKIIYTIDSIKYLLYQSKISLSKKQSIFDEMVVDYEIKEIETGKDYI